MNSSQRGRSSDVVGSKPPELSSYLGQMPTMQNLGQPFEQIKPKHVRSLGGS